MKNVVFILNILTLTLCFSSCSPDNLPKYIVLDRLRVLAIATSQSEVNPGETVTLTPYISDIHGDGNINYLAEACLDLGVAYGVEPTCDGNPSKTLIGQGSVSTLTAVEAYTGAAPQLNVTLPPTNIIFAQRSTQNQFNGVPYLVTYKLTTGDGRSLRSFKRIVVSNRTSKNNTPLVTDVQYNGASFTNLLLGQVVSLSLLQSGGAETYQEIKEDGNLTERIEELTATWFITDGQVKYYRTSNGESNEYTNPDSAAAGRKSLIVVVLHDNRGGASVKVQVLN